MCMIVSTAAILTLLQTDTHTNSASRMATVESLAERGTFCIDGSQFSDTADRVMIEGKYYSSKPPALSAMAAGVYALFSLISGMDFISATSASVAFVNILTGLIPYLLTLFFFYRLLMEWSGSPRTVSLGLLVFTFNYIGLGYATDINNHVPSAMCLLISFYMAFLIRRKGKGSAFRWCISGFMAGLASAFEFWAGLFAAAFAVYLILHDRRRTLLLFLPFAAVPVAGHFLLSLASTGSLLPVYLRPDLYQFQGGYWTNPTGIDAIREPKYIYFFNILLGHHGLVSMTPVFILAFYSIFREILDRKERFAEALTVLVPTLAALLFLGIRTRNYGGVCAGLRWMIMAMPLLFLFVSQWISTHPGKKAMVLLGILFLAGLVMLADIPWANAGPWHNSAWHKYVFGLY